MSVLQGTVVSCLTNRQAKSALILYFNDYIENRKEPFMKISACICTLSKRFSILVCCLATHLVFAQNQQVYLFGNLADVDDKAAFFQKLEKLFQQEKDSFTLILNGDFVDTQHGDAVLEEEMKSLYQLVDLLAKFKQGQMLLVPGDREWNASKQGGEKTLKNIEKSFLSYKKEHNYTRIHWGVKKGCPGPKTFEAGASLAIITLNSQWWNHPFDKPRPTDASCDGLSHENLKEELADALDDYQNRNVLIVGHHPFYSLGNYGGYFSLADHFNPFPGIGLFRTAFHAHIGNAFDLANDRMQVYHKMIRSTLNVHENIIYAAGHEKNQQIIAYGDNFLLNSGAPTTARYAAKDHNTLLSKKTPGILRLSYGDDGQVHVSFLENTDAGLVTKEAYKLFSSACKEEQKDSTLVNHAWIPCRSISEATSTMQATYTEDTTLAPGPEYKAGGMKRFWFGSHYRSSWTQEISVPYLDLDQTYGGLVIYKKGGGRQTTSLKFRSGDGSVYTFRSVNKNPVKALDYSLRETVVADITKDQTSTQQPYGALVVAPLLEKIHLLHATPILYLLPNDPKLGPFQEKYGNLFGMLEENPSKPNHDGKLFGDADKIEKSTKMIKRFYNEQDASLDTDEFVRARLFDILVGDWSKHEDNWKWAAYKTDSGRRYRPIPRDRDHVFSLQDGVLNWIADRPFGLPNLENFGLNYTGLKSLTSQAKHMDRFLMQEVSRDGFVAQATYIRDHISDQDIEEAIQKMPSEIAETAGSVIEKKLKNRIQTLPQAADDYYGFLSREVDITGSKEREYFEVEQMEKGCLQLRMYNVVDDKKGEKLLYHRTFLPDETKEIRIWGLGNDDIFHFIGEGNEGRKIKLSVFGGPGDDQFKGHCFLPAWIYDKGKETEYHVEGRSKIVKHWNDALYEYDRQRFANNSFLPMLSIGYSAYTGFGGSLSGNWTRRKFERDNYSSKHKLKVGFTTLRNYSLEYKGRFHQRIKKWDILLDGFVSRTNLQNRFYGIGNGSENLIDQLGRDYYASSVNTDYVRVGIIRDFWKKSSFQVALGLERNETDLRDENTFLAQNKSIILGTTGSWKTVPLSAKLDLDFRDNGSLPYKGGRIVLNVENQKVLGEMGPADFGKASGWVSYFLSTKGAHPLTLGLRAGGATSYGDLPWFQLPTLGTNNGLRGYIQDRFAGASTAFFNSELRYQFVHANTAIVPVKIGVKVFMDYGRVFHTEITEPSDWRMGYGFGLFLTPLSERLTLSLSFGFSEEESIYPVFSLGMPLR